MPIAVKANVLDRASLEEARDAVVAKYGRIDVLINGAGGNKKQATVSPELDFFHLDVDAFKWVFDLNVTGAVLTTMVFGELLAKQGTGNVINIASMATLPPPDQHRRLLRRQRRLWPTSPNGWRRTSTRITARTSASTRSPPAFADDAEQIPHAKGGRHAYRPRPARTEQDPDGTLRRPGGNAGPVIWLCSEAASFVNGAVIPVDGGFSSFWGI